MQHLVSRVVFCVLLLIETFAVVVFIRNIDQLDFDFSIRFVELLTLGTTVFLAWWVAKRLEKGVSEERFEKELLIKKLADLDGELKEFKNWIDKGSSFLATLMESKLKEYRSVSSQISSELTCRYDSISKDINKGNSLPYLITKLKKLCTLVPADQNDNSICLQEEEYIYNSDRLNEIDKQIILIRDKIFRLQLRINRE